MEIDRLKRKTMQKTEKQYKHNATIARINKHIAWFSVLAMAIAISVLYWFEERPL